MSAERWEIVTEYQPSERELERLEDLQWIIKEELDRIERLTVDVMIQKEEFYENMRSYIRVIR